MKNLFLSAGLLAALVFAACTDPAGGGTGGSNNSGGNGNGGDQTSVVDGVTFSDGVPPGTWSLIITSSTVNSKETFFSMAGNYTAGATSSSVSGNKAAITEMPGHTFNRNGTYNLVLVPSVSGDGTGGTIKYTSSVKFTNGNAVITYSGMIDIVLY
jgi:hypothetical protein